MPRKTQERISRPLRVPPQSIEAEQWILGGLLIENGALHKVLGIISEKDFYKETHQKIFGAVVGLYEKNEPQDIITVTDYLRSRNQLEEVGGAAYLASLADAVPTAANITYYAKIVQEKSILRNLIQTASKIGTLSYESADAEEVLELAQKEIFDIAQYKIKQQFVPLNAVLAKAIQVIEKRYNRKELVTGVPTGFKDLDRITTGLQPSDLIIIAGRPSMGKTSLALNIAQHAAIKGKVPVAVFSLEMSKEQLAMRMLCAEANVDAHKVRRGYLVDRDWAGIMRAAGNLADAPIFIDDTAAISVLEMRAKARLLKLEHDLGLVIIDYLQLMRSRGPMERREQEISEISRSLKAMAKELDVPVIALSQLNRRLEERPNKRPQLSDLRESGAIEQDADVIIFIYRDKVYNKNEEDHTAELIVGKQRNGPTGVAKLTFREEYSCFEDQIPTEFLPEMTGR